MNLTSFFNEKNFFVNDCFWSLQKKEEVQQKGRLKIWNSFLIDKYELRKKYQIVFDNDKNCFYDNKSQ